MRNLKQEDANTSQKLTILNLLAARGIEGDERMQESSVGFVSPFSLYLKASKIMYSHYNQNVFETFQVAEAASCDQTTR